MTLDVLVGLVKSQGPKRGRGRQERRSEGCLVGGLDPKVEEETRGCLQPLGPGAGRAQLPLQPLGDVWPCPHLDGSSDR